MPNETLTEVQLMQRANLSVRQSQVWYNIRINGWSNGEVARALNLAVGTVDGYLFRADKKIEKTRELMQTERAQRERTDISGYKDATPGNSSDYTNAPLAAVCHADIRDFVQAELKRWEQESEIILKKVDKAA